MNEKAQRSAYVEAILERLRQHYAERTPLYWDLYRIGRQDDHLFSFGAFTACRCDDGAVTLAQLRRLYQAVISEGYGE